MTDSLLDNELIKKYFGNPKDWIVNSPGYFNEMSLRVLQAMQQPIRKGERYLAVWHCVKGDRGLDHIDEQIADQDQANWHPDWLRLPDAFQNNDCVGDKHRCKCGEVLWTEEKPTPSPFGSEAPAKIGSAISPSSEKCECKCQDCGEIIYPHSGHVCKPKDAAVEEKIERIHKGWASPWGMNAEFKEELRDLVRLAKESVPECEGDH